jgi:hypothetical protein
MIFSSGRTSIPRYPHHPVNTRHKKRIGEPENCPRTKTQAGGPIRYIGKLPGKRLYWLIVPDGLTVLYRKKHRCLSLNSHFIRDVLRAQVCLYLAIRIHDDLYDQHEKRLSLIWEGDAFLLKAQRAMTDHFGRRSPFWEYYHRSISTTIRAVREIDSSQMRSQPHCPFPLKKYANLNSLFKIATHAVCLKAGRMRDFNKLSGCFDQLAIVGQMLDDFEDIIEDFNRGRVNSVARIFLNAGGSPRRKPLDRMAHNLLYTDVSTRLFRQLDRYLDKAQKSIECIELPALEEYLVSYRDSVRRIGERVHAQRVRQLFGGTGVSKFKTGRAAKNRLERL